LRFSKKPSPGSKPIVGNHVRKLETRQVKNPPFEKGLVNEIVKSKVLINV